MQNSENVHVDLNVVRNDLGLFEATCTLTVPTMTISRCKADRDDLEYELRNAFSELIGEVVTRHLKGEF